MLRRTFLIGAGMTTVAAWAKEPFSNGPNVKPPEPQPYPIVIGAIYNTKGAQKDLDGPALFGALLAVDEANREGGVREHRVKLVVVDGASDIAELQRKTRDLLDAQKPIAVVGLSDTEMVEAVVPLTVERNIPFITSGATSPQLPKLGRNVFLACFADNSQAAAAAQFAIEQGWKNAVVLEESEMEYARLLAGYFRTAFTQRGGQIVDWNVEPDVAFVACGPEQARARIDGLRLKGFTGPILGGDSFDGPDLGPDSRVYFTSHAYLPDHPRFVAEYLKLYPLSQPTAFSALGYDATKLALYAAFKARKLDVEGMADALDGVTAWDGITGDYYYTYKNRVPKKTVFVLQNPGRQLAAQLIPDPVPAP